MEARVFPDFWVPRMVRPFPPPIRVIQQARTRPLETDGEQGNRQPCHNPARLFRPILLRHGIDRRKLVAVHIFLGFQVSQVSDQKMRANDHC
jgi:hypothetical protein